MPTKKIVEEIAESLGDDIANRGDQLILTELDNAQLALEQKQAEFAKYLDELKKHENAVKELKEKLYARMEETGQKKIETNHLSITAVWGTKKHSYDMKALQAINPQLYAEVDNLVGKDVPIKGYIKISTKGEKK